MIFDKADLDKKMLNGIKITPTRIHKRKLKAYYLTLFNEYEHELFTVDQVTEITGYRNTTITSWIRTEKLEALNMPTRYLIPKKTLLVWLLSDEYNLIENKTRKHLKALWGAK